MSKIAVSISVGLMPTYGRSAFLPTAARPATTVATSVATNHNNTEHRIIFSFSLFLAEKRGPDPSPSGENLVEGRRQQVVLDVRAVVDGEREHMPPERLEPHRGVRGQHTQDQLEIAIAQAH